MKKIIYLVILAASLSFTSCSDYLDTDKYFGDTILFDSIWTNKSYTEGWLADAYSSIWSKTELKDVRKGGGGPLFSADDLIYGDWLDGDQRCETYQYGLYDADNQRGNDVWQALYIPVRKASLFINNVDKCQEMTFSEREDAKAQARFLRAYAYYKLIERYGPVPVLPDEGLNVEASYEELGVQRNTMDECTDFVCNELAKAASVLPVSRIKSELIRPTKGAALAIRAKMLNLAASPLYNSENTPIYNLVNHDGEKLVNNVFDEQKWARAAAAAKEVIELNAYKIFTVKNTDKTIAPPLLSGYSDKTFVEGGWSDIDPYLSYIRLFDGSLPVSQIDELIWVNDNENEIVHILNHCLPRYVNGYNTVAVTQKQVDAYQMCDGLDITNSSADYPYSATGFYNAADPEQVKCGYVQDDVSLRYVNREPRFYASVGYNGTIWECLSITQNGDRYNNHRTNYYKGGPDGKNLSEIGFHPLTGYVLRKYYNEEDASFMEGARMTDKYEVIVRYAEVLLWYAEAMNNLTKEYEIADYTNTSVVKVSRDVNVMSDCIRPIRVRSGLPDYDENIYASKAAFTTALKHERQIELFAEARRYYDLNRWLDAMTEQNEPLMGCNMEMSIAEEQKERFYTPVVITSMPKAFIERQYLWPIPGEELRRNIRMTQNTGW